MDLSGVKPSNLTRDVVVSSADFNEFGAQNSLLPSLRGCHAVVIGVVWHKPIWQGLQ
jgi:hypothetical protein